MTLFGMIKEIVTTKWVKANCPECGIKYKYPEGKQQIFQTCGRFECEFKHQHPELKEKRTNELV